MNHTVSPTYRSVSFFGMNTCMNHHGSCGCQFVFFFLTKIFFDQKLRINSSIYWNLFNKLISSNKYFFIYIDSEIKFLIFKQHNYLSIGLYRFMLVSRWGTWVLNCEPSSITILFIKRKKKQMLTKVESNY